MAKLGPKGRKVMKEYGKGELHSGRGGKKVTSPKQAFAIAKSEERRSKRRKRR